MALLKDRRWNRGPSAAVVNPSALPNTLNSRCKNSVGLMDFASDKGVVTNVSILS